jgi:hypothetical protein
MPPTNKPALQMTVIFRKKKSWNYFVSASSVMEDSHPVGYYLFSIIDAHYHIIHTRKKITFYENHTV